MKQTSKLLLITIFSNSLLLSTTCFGQPSLVQQVDNLYQKWDKDRPGAAVGIYKDGKMIFMKGYGLANLEHAIPFTTKTISDIGSVAKQMTDFAIVLLTQKGLISLDDPINKYLEEVPVCASEITIRHLIHHTSGLREIYDTEAMRGRRSGDAIFQEDVLTLLKQSKELNFTPGDQFLYCNTSYALLAEIVQKVGGLPFEEWMKTNIFLPLDMKDTYMMDKHGEIFPGMADSYAKQRDGSYTEIFDNSTIFGQGGVYTSLEDLAKWLMNLAKPTLGGASAKNQMLQRGVLNNGDTLNYAFGLYITEYNGIRRINHGGVSAGYRTQLAYFPDYDLGIIVKNNCPEVPSADVIDLVANFYLSDHFLKNPSGILEDDPANSTSFELPDDPLTAYVGDYYAPEIQTVYSFEEKNGRLVGYHFRNGTFSLIPVAKDAFKSEKSYMETINFIRNENGAITGFRASTGRVKHMWFKRLQR